MGTICFFPKGGRAAAEMMARARAMSRDLEIKAADAYREAVDQIVMTVCEHGSDDMVKALSHYMTDQGLILSNEYLKRTKESGK